MTVFCCSPLRGFFSFIIALCFFTTLTWAQTTVVKDINTAPAGQSSTAFCKCGAYTYFGVSGELGTELWRTDGTANGTVIVRDILPGFNSGFHGSGFGCVNGTLVFAASDGKTAGELWKTDGTTNGTIMLKDIAEAQEASNPRTFISYNGKIFFSALNTQSNLGLWVTDGTTAGTSLVAQLTTTKWSQILKIGLYSGGLYFIHRASDGTYELWTSDGTTNGTTMLRSSPWLYEALGVGDKIFFAESINNVQSLWITDGTIAGSTVVKTFPAATFPQTFFSLNDVLFFNANGIHMSDGTGPGTKSLLNGRMVGSVVHNGKFYGVGSDGTYSNFLFRSDGTSTGTEVIQDLSGGYTLSLPHYIPVINDKLIIPAMNDLTGIELSVTDGASGNMSLLKDIAPGIQDSNPASFSVAGDKLFFLADDGVHGNEVWMTDGTPGGTTFLKDCRPGTESSAFYAPTLIKANDNLLFMASEDLYGKKDLWRSDGTEAGTTREYRFASYASHVGMLETDALFFDDRKLYRSTGRPGEMSLFMDFGPLLGQSYGITINGFRKLNGKYIFYFYTSSDNTTLGGELWTTDGTTNGTKVIKDINPGPGSAINYLLGIVLGNKYIFAADNGLLGSELWTTDGTGDETKLIKDIQTGSAGSNPTSLTLFKGEIYFVANDGVNGQAIWKSNGTADGTVMIKSFGATDNPMIGNFAVLGEAMIFPAFDAANGWALWRTDGSAANTMMIKDIDPGKERNNALLWPTTLGDVVYFSADDGVHGREVWITDGTPNGTTLLDINKGPESSFPKNFTAIDDVVYFIAAGDLWKTNGTLSYTSVASDVEPIDNLIVKDDWIYYIGFSNAFGMELYKVKHEAIVVTDVEKEQEVSLTLFPNPATDALRLRSRLNEAVQVSVIDQVGRVYSTFALQPNSTSVHDITQLSNGFYICRIEGTRYYEPIKFIKR